MKCGIIGLPNVGKSTLFNAITNAGAAAANYPFCTIEPNEAAVAVPDPRLAALSKMFAPKKTTNALVSFVDIAGLVRGASRGEGLGNKFLSHIREADALIHVLRCFDDPNVQHVDGRVDPISDASIINLELVLADLDTVSKRLDKTLKQFKVGDKKLQLELDLLKKALTHLEQEQPIRTLSLTDAEKDIVKLWFLLTDKPVMYAANIGEDDVGVTDINSIKFIPELSKLAKLEGAELLLISSKIEAELSQMEETERLAFMSELGILESGLDRFAKQAYRLLGLISFLTAGPDECRAWTIKRGDKAPRAAGKIHSDFERGFIRAEIVPYDTLMREGSMNACRDKGLIRSEGKDYVMRDGDVTLFRFNV